MEKSRNPFINQVNSDCVLKINRHNRQLQPLFCGPACSPSIIMDNTPFQGSIFIIQQVDITSNKSIAQTIVCNIDQNLIISVS